MILSNNYSRTNRCVSRECLYFYIRLRTADDQRRVAMAPSILMILNAKLFASSQVSSHPQPETSAFALETTLVFRALLAVYRAL